MLEAFLATHFPALPAEDLLQETFCALVAALPDYRYEPESGRHFHNYLTGILRNKARRELRKTSRTPSVPTEGVSDDLPCDRLEASELDALREIALREFLNAPDVLERTKQIFLRVAVDGESAERVAEDFGISPNVVHQTKFRTIARLKATIERLERL